MPKVKHIARDLVFFYVVSHVALALILFVVLKQNAAEHVWAGNVWMGVETLEVNTAVATQYDLKTQHGLLITRIFVNSPAEVAGLKKGDVIRKWNGVSLTTHAGLAKALSKGKVNQKVKMIINRAGAIRLIATRLDARPGKG